MLRHMILLTDNGRISNFVSTKRRRLATSSEWCYGRPDFWLWGFLTGGYKYAIAEMTSPQLF